MATDIDPKHAQTGPIHFFGGVLVDGPGYSIQFVGGKIVVKKVPGNNPMARLLGIAAMAEGLDPKVVEGIHAAIAPHLQSAMKGA